MRRTLGQAGREGFVREGKSRIESRRKMQVRKKREEVVDKGLWWE